MAYQGTPTTGLLLERGPSGKSLSPYTSPRHSRRATPHTSPDRHSMKYIHGQNLGTTPKHGSHHDSLHYTSTPPKEHRRHGSNRSRRESQELLDESRGGRPKSQKDVNQVVGLMNDNLEALMVRDHKLQSISRRGSALENHDLSWDQGKRKPKRSLSCPGWKFWLILFALVFLLSCIGAAIFIVYVLLYPNEGGSGKNLGGHGDDSRYAHHDWSVHDSWDDTKNPVGEEEVQWINEGGIWSKSKPTKGREVVVKVAGQFTPGEQEVPEGELSEGHSPM